MTTANDTPKRILVIATRRIGDVLLATPLLHSLHMAYPNAELDVLVFENTRGILAGNPDIHDIITIPERPTPAEHFSLLKKLWRCYDLAISTLAGDRPTLYAWVAGKRRIGTLLATSKHAWKRRLLNAWVPFDNEHTHTVNMYLGLADLLGIKRHHNVLLYWNSQQAEHVAQRLSLSPGKRYAVLHVHPKFAYKAWHHAGWAALSDWLDAQGMQIVLTGSADPDELADIAMLQATLPGNTRNLAGQLNFNEVACLLAEASLYIGPDTVVTHIAAAMGTPTVALFGPSNPVKWGPWPRGFSGPANPFMLKGSQQLGNVALIQGAGDCVPCFQEGCQRHVNSDSDCLQQLGVAQVIETASRMIKIHDEK